MQWSPAPQKREQMVLFSQRLDDAVAAEHNVRLLDAILGRMDWSPWECEYDGRLGQPPIHPRVLASVILYGLLTRVRSSRKLEESLRVRLDFLWLAEGRTIDHTTLSEFRRRQGKGLKSLFVQIGLLARQLGWLALERLAFDGTRVRANNRRHGNRTPDELRQMREELRKKFEELEAQAKTEDARDEETYGQDGASPSSPELNDTRRRLAQLDAALAELQRVEEEEETVPSRIPLTDPQSRVTPNKEGGFAPNYTPLATVDVTSGLIVAADVVAMTNEDVHLVKQLESVQEDFQLSTPPPEMLADGANCSGQTLAALEERGVTLFSPLATRATTSNPALRADLTQPVAEQDWDLLPTDGKKSPQLHKEAFVYSSTQDCYWCPQGKKLSPVHQTSQKRRDGRIVWTRYKAEATVCIACPLRARCLKPGAKRRQISRDQFDSHRERHAQRMATPEAQEIYAQRQAVGERPFAIIKHHLDGRRFLLRGLDKVRIEWRWLSTAFNLQRLISLLRSRAGPELNLSFLLPLPSS